jgi:MYXO-CTERM domain-containing protein
MKRHATSLLVGSAILLLSTASLRAGYLDISTDLPGDVALPNLQLGELSISAPASQLLDFNIYITVDSDPRFNVWASIVNDTTTPWDSYTVTITPASGYTVSNLTSKPVTMGYVDYLPVATVDTATNSVTYSGGIVPVGAELQVLYYFDILTSGTPQFNTTTSYHPAGGSTPAPEPASLGLLAVGAPLLLRRRRR